MWLSDEMAILVGHITVAVFLFLAFVGLVLGTFIYTYTYLRRRSEAKKARVRKIRSFMDRASKLSLEEAVATLQQEAGIVVFVSRLLLPSPFWSVGDIPLMAKTLATLLHWSRCHYNEFSNHKWLAKKLMTLAEKNPTLALGIMGELMLTSGVEGGTVLSYYTKP